MSRVESDATTANGSGSTGDFMLTPDESPVPGRKLFGSPGLDGDIDVDGAAVAVAAVESELNKAATGSTEEKDEDEGDEADNTGVDFEPTDAAEACRMLVGGEITSYTFDVEAFLPLAAASMGSLSQMSSPIGESKVRPMSRGPASAGATAEWFDPELDSSLSPILTPSLRHTSLAQLKALMSNTKSPTPSGRTPASRSGGGAVSRAQHLLSSGVLGAISSGISGLSGAFCGLTSSGCTANNAPSAAPPAQMPSQSGAPSASQLSRSAGSSAHGAPPPVMQQGAVLNSTCTAEQREQVLQKVQVPQSTPAVLS